MDIVLVGGLWLTGSAWDDVAGELRALGHHPVPVTLPGQGDGATDATLGDQLAAVRAAVGSASGKPLLVGHSAACSLVWLAVDAAPEDVSGVVLIGGFPTTHGKPYADHFEIVGGAAPFPGWDVFEGPDSADLDDEARRRFLEAAVPVPEAVVKAVVRFTDERRFDVPVTVVCPEFSPADVEESLAAGDIPELRAARRLALVDVDTGHWPMLSKPAELARTLADIAAGS